MDSKTPMEIPGQADQPLHPGSSKSRHHSFEVVDGVTADELAKAAADCLDEQPWWHQLAARSGDEIAMRHGLGNLTIPAALRFNLTLARQQRPTLYRHSLRVALLCHYLAIRLELHPALTDMLLLAAVSHDLGELQIDSTLIVPEHRITGEERRFVRFHPITGYLVLQDIAGVAPQVARAVLHHHERLDGSGYPSGLDGDAISPLGRVLMVADVAESILARFPDRRRLSTMLRLNSKKYDSKSVALLHDALIAIQAPVIGAAGSVDAATQTKLSAVAAVLSGWENLRRALDTPANAQDGDQGDVDFLFAHIHDLHSMLMQFGFNPDNIHGLADLAGEDSEIAGELVAVLDELQFQLRDMSHEIDRRGIAFIAAREAFAAWQQTLQAAVSFA